MMTNTYENKSEEMLENGDYIYSKFRSHSKIREEMVPNAFIQIVMPTISLLINHEIDLGNMLKSTIQYQNEIVLRYVSGCLKNTLAPERL